MEKATILRRILSELRNSSSRAKVQELPLAQYILQQYRKYQVTDQQFCKEREEMHHFAETYLCYLESTRKYEEIHQHYHGKGERSVKETADMVGFKLPHDPK